MDGNHPHRRRRLSLTEIYTRAPRQPDRHWYWCERSRTWKINWKWDLCWGRTGGRSGGRIRRVPWPGAEYLQNPPNDGADVIPENNINQDDYFDEEDEDSDDEDVHPAEMHNAADVLPNLIHQLQQQLQEHHNPADEDLLILNQHDVRHFLWDEIIQLQPQVVHRNPVDEDLPVLNQLDAGHVLLDEINQVHDTVDVLPPEISQLPPQVEHPQLEYPLVNQLDAGDIVTTTQVASSSENDDLRPPAPGNNINQDAGAVILENYLDIGEDDQLVSLPSLGPPALPAVAETDWGNQLVVPELPAQFGANPDVGAHFPAAQFGNMPPPNTDEVPLPPNEGPPTQPQ